MSLELKVQEPSKNAVVLAVTGEVDLSSSPALREAMAPHLKKKRIYLVVELSGVSYMDSSGIATLIEAMKLCQKAGSKLRIAAPSEAVLAVFKMAHLDKIFDLCPSCEVALKGCRE